MVVITVVYATAEPRRAHASRTLISPDAHITRITSVSSEPRPASKISRDDLNPQNRYGRCIVAERRTAPRRCQFLAGRQPAPCPPPPVSPCRYSPQRASARPATNPLDQAH